MLEVGVRALVGLTISLGNGEKHSSRIGICETDTTLLALARDILFPLGDPFRTISHVEFYKITRVKDFLKRNGK